MAVAGTSAALEQDVALLAECAAFHASDTRIAANETAHRYDEGGLSDEIAVWYGHLTRITAMSPSTAEGLRAKAKAALTAMATVEGGTGREEECLVAVVRDMLGAAP